MSQGSDETDEMRPEYDMRGGERGRYFARYWGLSRLTASSFGGSPFVVQETTAAAPAGSITRPCSASYTPVPPSPKIHIGSPLAEVHEG